MIMKLKRNELKIISKSSNGKWQIWKHGQRIRSMIDSFCLCSLSFDMCFLPSTFPLIIFPFVAIVCLTFLVQVLDKAESLEKRLQASMNEVEDINKNLNEQQLQQKQLEVESNQLTQQASTLQGQLSAIGKSASGSAWLFSLSSSFMFHECFICSHANCSKTLYSLILAHCSAFGILVCFCCSFSLFPQFAISSFSAARDGSWVGSTAEMTSEKQKE